MLLHTSACGVGRRSLRAAVAWWNAARASANQQEQAAAGVVGLQQARAYTSNEPPLKSSHTHSNPQQQQLTVGDPPLPSGALLWTSQHMTLAHLGILRLGMQTQVLLPYQQARSLSISTALRKRLKKGRPRAEASAAADFDQEDAASAEEAYEGSSFRFNRPAEGAYEGSSFKLSRSRAAPAARIRDEDLDDNDDEWHPRGRQGGGSEARRKQELEDYYYSEKPRDRRVRAQEYEEGDRRGARSHGGRETRNRQEQDGEGRGGYRGRGVRDEGEEDWEGRGGYRGRGVRGRGEDREGRGGYRSRDRRANEEGLGQRSRYDRDRRSSRARPLTDPGDGWYKGVERSDYDDSSQQDLRGSQPGGRRLQDWHRRGDADASVRHRSGGEASIQAAISQGRPAEARRERGADTPSDKRQWGQVVKQAVLPAQHNLALLQQLHALSKRVAADLSTENLLLGMSCAAMVNRTLTKQRTAAISLTPSDDNEKQQQQAELVQDIMTMLTAQIGTKLSELSGVQVSKLLLAAATTGFTLDEQLLQEALATIVQDGCSKLLHSPEKALVQLLQALASMPAIRQDRHHQNVVELAAASAASEVHGESTPAAAAADSATPRLPERTRQLLQQLMSAVTELLSTQADALNPDGLAQMTNSLAQLACSDLDMYDAVVKSLVKREQELSAASVAQLSIACNYLMRQGCCIPPLLQLVAKRVAKKPTILTPASWAETLRPFVHFQHDDPQLFRAVLRALPQVLHEVPPLKAALILNMASAMDHFDVAVLDTVMKHVAAGESGRQILSATSTILQVAQRAEHYEPQLCEDVCNAAARSLQAELLAPSSSEAAASASNQPATQAFVGDAHNYMLRTLIYLLAETATMGLVNPRLQLQILSLLSSQEQELFADKRALVSTAAAELAALAERATHLEAHDRRALLEASLAAAAAVLEQCDRSTTPDAHVAGVQQAALLLACMGRLPHHSPLATTSVPGAPTSMTGTSTSAGGVPMPASEARTEVPSAAKEAITGPEMSSTTVQDRPTPMPTSMWPPLPSTPYRLLSLLYASGTSTPSVCYAQWSPSEGLIVGPQTLSDAATASVPKGSGTGVGGRPMAPGALPSAVARMLKAVQRQDQSQVSHTSIPAPPVDVTWDVTWIDEQVVIVHPSGQTYTVPTGPVQAASSNDRLALGLSQTAGRSSTSALPGSMRQGGLAFVLTGARSVKEGISTGAEAGTKEAEPSQQQGASGAPGSTSTTGASSGLGRQQPVQQGAAWPYGGGAHALRCKLLACVGYQVVEVTHADWQRVQGWEDAEVALLQSKAGLLS